MSRIYLSPPDVRDNEREMLAAAVTSGWAAPAGPDLEAFEAEVAAATGRAHGVGLASGTAALHLALLELGVGPGDEVLVPTFTFIASASPVVHCGASPVFVDSEPGSWNLSPDLLEEVLSARRVSPKAAVVVDLYGQCADYGRIIPILEDHGVPLVGDATEALGAAYMDRPAGAFGECSAMSFNGNKIITTSGGGMLLTDDAKLASRARHLATQAREPVAHYEHTEVGFNYRLSNLLAAFGRGQLQTLEDRVARRRQIRDRYAEAFRELEGIRFMPVPEWSTPNCWLTCVTIDADVMGSTPEDVRIHLEAADIESRPLWKPMHLQPAFAGAPAHVDGTAEGLFRSGLCLPSGSGMTDDDQDRVIEAFLGSLRQ